MTRHALQLKGSRALITGASLGLGRAIAEAYLREGADLFLCARHPEHLETTGQALRAAASPGQNRSLGILRRGLAGAG